MRRIIVWLLFIGTLIWSVNAHAIDWKAWVPGLTTATTPGATDYYALVQGGATKKVLGTSLLYSANNLNDVASASSARTNLGLAIGTNVEAWSANLDTWSGITPGTGVGTALGNALNSSTGLIGNLTPTNNNCAVGNGTAWTSAACPGGSTTTGFGVDGGTNVQTVTGTATINNNAEEVAVNCSSSCTLTLPAISAIPSPTEGCIRFHDVGATLSGSVTLTVKGGAADGLNGGAVAGTVGPITTPGSEVKACAIATHNWQVTTNTLATSTAPSHQFANSLGVNGLGYAQPAIGDISGLGTGVATALGVNTNTANGFCTAGNACTYHTATIGWPPTVNPNNNGLITFPATGTLVSLVGNVEVATGGTATVSVNLASSGTACSAGTTVHSGSLNANGTAATNQTLTLTTTAVTAGQRLCLQTTGTTTWTGGTGVGSITVAYTVP